MSRWMNVFSAAVLCLPTLTFAQHPSGLASRVLVLVQNPQNINGAIDVRYSLMIESADGYQPAQNSGPSQQYFHTISNWSTANPFAIENLSAQGFGAVTSDDGSLALIDYGNESVAATNLGIGSPSAGSIVTPDLRYVFAANRQLGALTAIDTSTPDGPIQLNLPGANAVSINPSGSLALAFADDDDNVYVIRHLGSTSSVAYANGAWPANAVDCQPYGLPKFCLLKATAPSVSPATYSAQYFRRPFKAMTPPSGGDIYIVSGGSAGVGSKITDLPAGPLALEEGSVVGTLPATLATPYAVDGALQNAIIIGSRIYAAGQSFVPNSDGLWGGYLTVIDTSSGVVTGGLKMADGTPVRMVAADDNTLWIGSIHCNTGVEDSQIKQNGGTSPSPLIQEGCLTVVDTGTSQLSSSVAFIEPRYFDVETSNTTNTITGSGGDVTGIAPIPGKEVVYYVENGQVHVRSTKNGFGIVSAGAALNANSLYNLVMVPGTAIDVAYIDSPVNVDNTNTNSVR